MRQLINDQTTDKDSHLLPFVPPPVHPTDAQFYEKKPKHPAMPMAD